MTWTRTPAAKGVLSALGFAAWLGAVMGVTYLLQKLGEATAPWVGWTLLVVLFAGFYGGLRWYAERGRQRRERAKRSVA